MFSPSLFGQNYMRDIEEIVSSSSEKNPHRLHYLVNGGISFFSSFSARSYTTETYQNSLAGNGSFFSPFDGKPRSWGKLFPLSFSSTLWWKLLTPFFVPLREIYAAKNHNYASLRKIARNAQYYVNCCGNSLPLPLWNARKGLSSGIFRISIDANELVGFF